MPDLSDHPVCEVPAPVPPMRVPHPGQGTCHIKIAQVRMVSCFGLSWRPKVLIIFPSLIQEWRGDYVGMVLYLDDQHGILRLQVAALSA
jgi:hypothetical protein